MATDRRFDPRAARSDYRRTEFDNPEWRTEGESEQYFGTGSHYGGGFGTAPGSRASGAGASGAMGYAREGAWSDESDWNPEQQSPEQQSYRQESYRGRGPTGYTRSDERLREIICERLTDDPHIDASEIEVDVQGQRVTLRGSVSDRRTKYEVEELVERAGAREIENQLRVSR